MNPDATALARITFLHAAQPGLSREPVSVAATLTKLHSQRDGTLFDAGEFEGALDAEFPWYNQLVSQSRLPKPNERDAWTQAVRWLMQALLSSDMKAADSADRVQVLLSALGALDVGYEGLSAVSERFAGTHVPASIISMMHRVEHIPEVVDARSNEWLQELPAQVKAGNFKMLKQAQRVLLPRFSSDIWTAVFLLWKLQPVELARLISSRESIYFAITVCIVLGPNAPLFALQVESVTFKFVSLSWFVQLKDTYPDVNPLSVLEQLLLQVAQTPYWKEWLHATYEYPEAGSGESIALAEALAKLKEVHWRDFIFATALSKSRGSAEAIADILTRVLAKLGSVEAKSIWSDAFERWNAWDYGKGEEHFYLSSPQVCAFDFPVAMYYAQMPTAERDALEQLLENAIALVEQQWFVNESALCSERNRLASRLRLVRHGRALTAGGENALPPPVRPDSEYAEVRYRYRDVNETLPRIIRR